MTKHPAGQVQGHWVLSRVLLRAEMSLTIPRFGKAFDLAMLYDDYVINGGLPDSLFVSRP